MDGEGLVMSSEAAASVGEAWIGSPIASQKKLSCWLTRLIAMVRLTTLLSIYKYLIIRNNKRFRKKEKKRDNKKLRGLIICTISCLTFEYDFEPQMCRRIPSLPRSSLRFLNFVVLYEQQIIVIVSVVLITI